MKLTPLDIRKQEFSRRVRGVDPEEVTAFLQMIASQWEEVQDDHRRLEERVRELENKLDHYRRVEEALQEALRGARDNAKDLVDNARGKAQNILDEAWSKSAEIKRDAEEDRRKLKRDASRLTHRRDEIVTRLRAFLISEMEMLARYEGDDAVGFIKLLPAEERMLQEARDAAAIRAEERAAVPEPDPEQPVAPEEEEEEESEPVTLPQWAVFEGTDETDSFPDHVPPTDDIFASGRAGSRPAPSHSAGEGARESDHRSGQEDRTSARESLDASGRSDPAATGVPDAAETEGSRPDASASESGSSPGGEPWTESAPEPGAPQEGEPWTEPSPVSGASLEQEGEPWTEPAPVPGASQEPEASPEHATPPEPEQPREQPASDSTEQEIQRASPPESEQSASLEPDSAGSSGPPHAPASSYPTLAGLEGGDSADREEPDASSGSEEDSPSGPRWVSHRVFSAFRRAQSAGDAGTSEREQQTMPDASSAGEEAPAEASSDDSVEPQDAARHEEEEEDISISSEEVERIRRILKGLD